MVMEKSSSHRALEFMNKWETLFEQMGKFSNELIRVRFVTIDSPIKMKIIVCRRPGAYLVFKCLYPNSTFPQLNTYLHISSY